MIKLFILFLLPLTLFGSKILSYNVYDRTDRVDVMITFDTPYEGVIKQSTTDSQIIIKLEDTEIEGTKIKKLSSAFLNSITITPAPNYTQIVASVPQNIVLQASKTSDSYGLRLRFTNQAEKQQVQNAALANSNPLAALPTKKSEDMSSSYYMVVVILILGILILFYLKNKISNSTKNKENESNSWLFKSGKPPAAPTTDNNNNNVSIRFQKSINNENSVVMLDFGVQSYLVLMGTSNILLDKFSENKPQTQDDFETILRNRHQDLEEFLQVNNSTTSTEEKEPLQIYKEKASSISYEV